MEETVIKPLFDIKRIKELYPELNRCFGFTYDDISNELAQIYSRKVLNLSKEEKELANQCKSETGFGIDPIKFALSSDESIAMKLANDFDLVRIMNSYVKELCHDLDVGDSLLFMAALLYRDRLDDPRLSDWEYEEMRYQQYIHEVRPDMLQLYIAINESECKVGEPMPEVKLSVGANPSITISNKDNWFNYKLNKYLHRYLGVSSVKDAKKELNIVYGDKVGHKIDHRATLYMWGAYQLISKSNLQSSENSGPTSKCTSIILKYLISLGFIDDSEIKLDDSKVQKRWKSKQKRNIRSKINYYIKQGYTLEDILDSRNYKSSPNNIGGIDLW